jgi:ornithine cyclodeaminase/alanine dehydrogenase-like protein (mu-crystallin family)
MTSDSVGTPVRFVGGDELVRLLPVAEAVDALAAAFGGSLAEAPERHVHRADGGELLLMPAWGSEGVGVKLVCITPGNADRGLPLIHGVYVLFAPGTHEPLAILDGAALTALRTAAVSALATRHLARPDAESLLIVGAGRQAHAHLDAMLAVRPIRRVAVAGRDPGRAAALLDRARAAGLETSDEVEADIVCTCTTSPTPVLEDLPEGVHVNATGAYRPDMRELPTAAIAAATVFVETRAAALAEAGDLLHPIEEGAWSADRIAGDLADVVAGRAGRTSERERTVFKSVGVALEDLAVAAAVAGRLERA